MDDIYKELETVYDNCSAKGFKVGHALYTHSNFIVNNIKLLNQDYQDMIKKYYYSKMSKTPPYSSVEETPVDFIDNYLIIDFEANYIANMDKK